MRPARAPMSGFERWLTLWVFLCIGAGILLGQAAPGLSRVVGGMEIARVNLPVGVLIWAMIIPMLMRVDFGALRDVRRHVKGIGVALEERGLVQVSMNLVDYEKNALYRVLETIRMEAKRYGVSVVETEVYGMVPAGAVLDSAAYYLQIAGFDPQQIIELRLLQMMGEAAQ